MSLARGAAAGLINIVARSIAKFPTASQSSAPTRNGKPVFSLICIKIPGCCGLTYMIPSVFRITTLHLLDRDQRKTPAVPPYNLPSTGSPGSDMYVFAVYPFEIIYQGERSKAVENTFSCAALSRPNRQAHA